MLESTQQDGAAAPALAGCATGKIYSLRTEAVHQLDKALCAFTIIAPPAGQRMILPLSVGFASGCSQ